MRRVVKTDRSSNEFVDHESRLLPLSASPTFESTYVAKPFYWISSHTSHEIHLSIFSLLALSKFQISKLIAWMSWPAIFRRDCSMIGNHAMGERFDWQSEYRGIDCFVEIVWR